MKVVGSFFLFFLCFIFTNCNRISEKQISGKWFALSLTTDSAIYTKEVELVCLEFKPTQQYHYSGTLGYRETGTFRLKDSLIYLNSDSTYDQAIILKIKKISLDTLQIEMKGQQLLTLVK